MPASQQPVIGGRQRATSRAGSEENQRRCHHHDQKMHHHVCGKKMMIEMSQRRCDGHPNHGRVLPRMRRLEVRLHSRC